jgi:aspartate ammonia-lyase
VDATQNTDGYTEVSAMLKVCMMKLSKIANDLRMMAGPALVGGADGEPKRAD